MLSLIEQVNEILFKHYKIKLSLDEIQKTISDLYSISESDSDGLWEAMGACIAWESHLKSVASLTTYYMGFFENKQEILLGIQDTVKKDIKKKTLYSLPLAKKYKISESVPEKILEAVEWLIKCNKHDISVFKRFISETNNYSRLFKAHYFQCRLKLIRVRKSVDIDSKETET